MSGIEGVAKTWLADPPWQKVFKHTVDVLQDYVSYILVRKNMFPDIYTTFKKTTIKSFHFYIIYIILYLHISVSFTDRLGRYMSFC